MDGKMITMKNSLLLSFLAAVSIPVSAKESAPNIVFILADDMGYGDVSFLNEKSRIRTENLDRLASEGVVFTDAHSSSSVSTPTRYGIMTGRYNWRSTLKSGVLNGYSKALIAPERETMASMLKKVGYTTAGIGKWHLGWDWNNIDAGIQNVDFSKPVTNGPTTRGFDYFYGFCGSLDMAPYVYIENDMPTALPDRETVGKSKYGWWRKGATGSDFEHEKVLPNLIDRACRYIGEKTPADQPYFLYLPLPAPHTPILPVKEFQGKSGIGEYGDFVLMVDALVGKVMSAVEASGEADNTIIVFTTDNGCSPAAGIDEMERQGHYPNHIYRGMKSDLYDGGHRIPCILRWPGKVKHHLVDQTVCLTDFYATFAAINGYSLEDSEAEDSYDLSKLVTSSRKRQPAVREATVHHSITGYFSIRQGKWKLLLTASSGGWTYPQPRNKAAWKNLPPLQLYDMEKDPSEKTNLYEKYPEKARELRNLLVKYIEEGRSTPGAAQKNDQNGEWTRMKEILEMKL